jgi:hypothetical protein
MLPEEAEFPCLDFPRVKFSFCGLPLQRGIWAHPHGQEEKFMRPWIYGEKAGVRPLFQEHFTKSTGFCETLRYPGNIRLVQ